eukprot:3416850-Prymnesium_polylepis.1
MRRPCGTCSFIRVARARPQHKQYVCPLSDVLAAQDKGRGGGPLGHHLLVAPSHDIPHAVRPRREAHATRALDGRAVDLDGLRSERRALRTQLVTEIDERDRGRVVGERLDPDLHLAARAEARARATPEGGRHERHRHEEAALRVEDAHRLPPHWVLVDGDHLRVAQDGEHPRRRGAHVCADQERGREHRPHREVERRLGLGQRSTREGGHVEHRAVDAHLEHVGVVGPSGVRKRRERRILLEDGVDAAVPREDVGGRAPLLRERRGPLPGGALVRVDPAPVA